MLLRGMDKLRRVSAELAGGERLVLANIVLTSAQVKTLFSAPVELLGEPGLSEAYVPDSVTLYKPAGTAYGAGGNIQIKVGATVFVTSAYAGFMDQATVQARWIRPSSAAATAIVEIAPALGAPMTITCATANPTLGTSTLTVRVYGFRLPLY